MIGEISICGVYVQSIVFLFCIAVLLTSVISRLLAIIGFYTLVAYRPVTDIALFILLFAGVVWLSYAWGPGA
jgi:hypothetical protein